MNVPPSDAGKVYGRASAVQEDANKYHRVMQLLRAMRMEHGRCKPREARACTHCNAKDDLEKMIAEYRGAPVKLMGG